MASARRIQALRNMAERGTPGEADNARRILRKLGHSVPSSNISRSRLPARMGDAPMASIGSGPRALGSGRVGISAGPKGIGPRRFPMGPASSNNVRPMISVNQPTANVAAKRGSGTAGKKIATPPPPSPVTGNPKGTIPRAGMGRMTKAGLAIGGAAAVGVLMNRSGRSDDRGRQSVYRY